MVETHRGLARAAPWARVPTQSTKLSQFCHGCGTYVKKPLWQRWHECPCGISAQRDLYSAFLAAYLDQVDPLPSYAQPRYADGTGRSGTRPAPTHTSKR